jgi:hypothetical protein
MRWTSLAMAALLAACGPTPVSDPLSAAGSAGAGPGSGSQGNGCASYDGAAWYTYLGAVRARPHLVEQLQAATGNVGDAARSAAQLDIQEAAAPLRALITDLPEDRRVTGLGTIATALAELGDRAAVPALADLARRMAGADYTGWQETVDALRALGGPEAVDYARSFLVGLTDGTTQLAVDELKRVLPIVVEADARDVLPTLQALTSGGDEGLDEHTYAALMGARLRLGDEELVRRVRRELKAWVEDSLHQVFAYYADALGGEADDIPLLASFVKGWSSTPEVYDAFERMTEWLDAQDAAAPEGSAGDRRRRELARERTELIEGLVATTARVEENVRNNRRGQDVVRHFAALARLGDEDARQRLVSLISEDSTTVVPWIAARYAVTLHVDGAAEAAGELATRLERRGETRTEMLEALTGFVDAVAPELGASDARWTVLLLDEHPTVRERTLHQLAHLKTAGACDVVTGAVDGAMAEAIQEGLRALTVLGDACAGQVERLARSASAPSAARFMSIEVLAMMRSPAAEQLIRERREQGQDLGYVETAAGILACQD